MSVFLHDSSAPLSTAVAPCSLGWMDVGAGDVANLLPQVRKFSDCTANLELLERRVFQVYLVDSRQTKLAPGRPKTDVPNLLGSDAPKPIWLSPLRASVTSTEAIIVVPSISVGPTPRQGKPSRSPDSSDRRRSARTQIGRSFPPAPSSPLYTASFLVAGSNHRTMANAFLD